MRRTACVRRYSLIRKLIVKMHQIDLMGCYKFIGQWGDRMQSRYSKYVHYYNKHRFWWQPRIKL